MKNITLCLFLFIASFTICFSQSFKVSQVANLPEPRTYHQSITLPNGKVLIVGGMDYASGKFYKSCYIYDPNLDHFTKVNDIINPRIRFLATLLNNGNVLIFGGVDSTISSTKTAEEYNYITNKWEKVGDMNTLHVDGAFAKLTNGKVIVAGGDTTTVEEYNQNSKTWIINSYMNDIHGKGMTLTETYDNVLIAVGGTLAQNSLEEYSYNITPSTWSKSSLSTKYPKYYHQAYRTNDGKVIFSGSASIVLSDGTNCEYYTYNQGSNNKFYTTSSLPYKASERILFGFDNNLIINLDLSYNSNPLTPYKIAEYNNVNGVWTAYDSPISGRRYYAHCKLNNGKILISGGFGFADSTLITMYTFEPKATCTTIDANKTFTFSSKTDSVCYGKNASYTFSNLGSNETLNIYIGDRKHSSVTNTAPTVIIPNSKISYGNNIINLVSEQSGCQNQVYNQKINLNLYQNLQNKPTIINTQSSNELCGSSDKKIIKVNRFNTKDQIIWRSNIYLDVNADSIILTTPSTVYAQYKDSVGCMSDLSNLISLSKITIDKIHINNSISNICENASPITITATPIGGKFSGNGISSNGIFTPNHIIVGSNTIGYNYCGLSVTSTITVDQSNTVPANEFPTITWPGSGDTLCEGYQYGFSISNVLTNKYYAYFYANNKLIASSTVNGNSYISSSYYPSGSNVVVFKCVMKRIYPNYSCKSDSFIVTKTKYIQLKPSTSSNVIFPTSACLGDTLIAKVIQPSINTFYWFTGSNNTTLDNSKAVFSTTQNDTLYIKTLHSSNQYIIKNSSGFSCNYIHFSTVKTGTVNILYRNTSLNLDNTYYPSDTIRFKKTTIGNKWQFKIDNIASADTFTFANLLSRGKHQLQLYTQFNTGCKDSASVDFYVVDKAPNFQNAICYFDTLSSFINFNTTDYRNQKYFKTINDSENNMLSVGIYYYRNIYGQSIGYTEKHNSSGQLIWRIKAECTFGGYDKGVYLNTITLDNNDNAYISGALIGDEFLIGNRVIKFPLHMSTHAVFVAKINSAGEILWLNYAINKDYSKTSTQNKVGAIDLYYKGDQVYLSSILPPFPYWLNSKGDTLKTMIYKYGYSMHTISEDGIIIKPCSITYSNSSSSGFTIYNPDNSTSSNSSIVPISPKIKILNNNQMYLYGTFLSPINWGNFNTLSPLQTHSEFVSIYNLNTNQYINDFAKSGSFSSCITD